MAKQQRKTGPDRLGGAHPPCSGGYGDIDRSSQRVGEGDAQGVNPQETIELEGLSGMNPAAAVWPDERDDRSDEEIAHGQKQPDPGEPVRSHAPAGVGSEETDPDDLGDRVERQSLVTDGLDG